MHVNRSYYNNNNHNILQIIFDWIMLLFDYYHQMIGRVGVVFDNLNDLEIA